MALTLVQAIVPGSITGVSDTANISKYSTWSSGTQSMWGAIGTFGVLAVLLLIIGIALKAID
ncbi:MAG: hypothetical protein PHE73_09075 [Sulfurovaceae bacterium]|nr:hypothetical protein [Sulfurovaceae bacterium]